MSYIFIYYYYYIFFYLAIKIVKLTFSDKEEQENSFKVKFPLKLDNNSHVSNMYVEQLTLDVLSAAS